MAVLKISGLSKSFGIKTVFENVSFEVRSGERIGLVGANGAGKTTLLKCIMGAEEADKGSVKASDGAIIGYLRQDFNYTSHTIREEMEDAWKDVLYYKDRMETLARELESSRSDEKLVEAYGRAEARFEFLGGYDYESTTRKILTGLGFSDDDWDRDIHSFSGGQKVRINLAAAFVRHPDFLLLDEPTNHLDMGMLEWLEEYLRSYKGGILMISHDRYFLDGAATGIIDLENHHIRSFRGGYTRYMETKENQDRAYEKAYEKQQEHIKETEEYIRRYKAGIKAKQARGRQSQLNRLVRLEKPVHQASLRFHFDPPQECADKVLDVLRVEGSYGSHILFKDLTIHIKKGETVGLIGPNGAGKTTILKMITGEKKPDTGFIQLGNNVKMGYYSQEQERLHPKLTVLDEVRDTFNFGEKEARNILGMFLFRGDDVFKTVGMLSGGEKARLSLLCLFLEKPNFLILDEPTNHLDIPTREIMEDAIEAFGGTCLVVSHDRYFLDKVADRILELDHGKLTEYLGNYSYYKEKKQDLEAFEKDRNGKEEEEEKEKEEKPRENEHQVKTEVSAADVSKLSHVEMEIGRLEATMKMYTVQMSMNPENYAELADEYEEAKKKLDKLYAKWDELAEKTES
ncbi:ABC-F family ATP-binding cassette domain-containing protein [Dialister succinatiphilus]|jgi:ABC transporter, ATP-binding protein|uniref:ABC-F family ATP-binding cassette domain-containing protein n=1 Tax=Dialister succinatiphilus TaxID=487173 RepID=UPI002355B186|nr:ABC-F family ATP-binding cassette domain-containing protein [Dialister succinatiphilus]MCI6030312.1 ABC-F family ATP-binding cassette domain-containing protein [Dialister succinatiphilus]